MKKTMIAAAALVCFAASAFAADPAPAPAAAPAVKAPEQKDAQAVSPDQAFEQRKARILKHLEQSIAKGQEAKACFEAAKNSDDLKACKSKFKHKSRKHHPKKDRKDKPMADQPAQPAQPAQPQK